MKNNTSTLQRRFFSFHKPVFRCSKQTDVLFSVAKVALLCFLILYIGIPFQTETTKDVSIVQIQSAMEQDSSLSALIPGDANTWKRNFSLQAEEYPNAILYTSDSMMDVSELLIVKTDTTEQFDDLEAAVNHHLEEQKKKFNGYGTDQMDLLEHAVILEKGNYFFYGVSEQVEQWEEVFLSCI